ncbi:MAG: metallophosphoesterase [Nitrosomonadales bacterium]
MNRQNKSTIPWLWLAAVAVAALWGYGFWIEPNWLEVSRHDIGSKKERTPIRLVQLSDVHLAEIDKPIKKVIAAVQELKPDVIVLSGDVVDRADVLPLLDEFLSSLGDMPKIAVLGNWEYWSQVNRKALKVLYAKHNVTLLINDCSELLLQGRAIGFVGMDDALSGKPDYQKVLSRCDIQNRDTILIEHSPHFFGKPLDTPAANPPFLFSLSGHTHGGQIAVFGHPVANPPGSGAYTSGWYQTKYGQLYVSRGIGMSEVPIRLGARPEVAVFEVN